MARVHAVLEEEIAVAFDVAHGDAPFTHAIEHREQSGDLVGLVAPVADPDVKEVAEEEQQLAARTVEVFELSGEIVAMAARPSDVSIGEQRDRHDG